MHLVSRGIRMKFFHRGARSFGTNPLSEFMVCDVLAGKFQPFHRARPKMPAIHRFLLILPVFFLHNLLADFVYTVDFKGTNLDSRLFVDHSPKYGAGLPGSELELFKEEGLGPGTGAVNVYSSFYVTGDFSISVLSHRGTGSVSSGLGVQSVTTQHYQAMYRTGPHHFWAARCHPIAGCDSRGAFDDQATNVVLRIRREGTTITSEFDAGQGFVTLMQSDLEGFDSPMRLKLFLIQEAPGAYPPPYTEAGSAIYDDLWFESQGVQSFVPGTYTTSATISSELRICWPSESGKRYQLQWSRSLDASNWLNLGGPLIGDGQQVCFSDAEPAETVRFYRVETLPD